MFRKFIYIIIFIASSDLLVAQLPVIKYGKYIGAFDIQVENNFVKENNFISRKPNLSLPPKFADVKNQLPQPFWNNNPEAIKAYWKAWELAFAHLEAATEKNRYISPYIDPHFNGCIFLWDNSFMTMFGKYGEKAFHFQGSLDNFYKNQDRDGYICRQIINETGNPSFEKNNLVSTGPNVFPWAEWEYYLTFRDKKRLSEVFPVLVAYHDWTKKNRSWQDGTYFSSGWGSGMDNQARLEPGYNVEFEHGFMSWVDVTMQEIFSGKTLLKMAKELKREDDVIPIKNEVEYLEKLVNEKMWDEESSYYFDKQKNGNLTKVLGIGSYWALLADVVPQNKLQKFVNHLSNPNEFARTIRVPSLSASDKKFKPNGDYWNGSVWAPTSYMVLRGLSNCKQDSLAYEIGKNYHDGVVKVFSKTNTFFENYAPDYIQGNDRKDFVGWTGLVPINIMFEYVMGIRPNNPENTIILDVRLLDEYGVKNYPFGVNGTLDITVKKRNKTSDKPKVIIKSNIDVKVILKWQNGEEILNIKKK